MIVPSRQLPAEALDSLESLLETYEQRAITPDRRRLIEAIRNVLTDNGRVVRPRRRPRHPYGVHTTLIRPLP